MQSYIVSDTFRSARNLTFAIIILFSTINQVLSSKSFSLSGGFLTLFSSRTIHRHSTVSKGRIRSRSAGAFRRAAFKGQTPAETLREVGGRQSRRMDEKIQTSATSPNFRVVDHRSTGYWKPLDHGWCRLGAGKREGEKSHACATFCTRSSVPKSIYIATWFILRLCKYCI